MRKILLFLFIVSYFGAFAQITQNPKIKKKSTKDVSITKVEITPEHTIVSMEFVAKTQKETLKEYFENNPKQKRELENINPMERQMILMQMMQSIGGATISFQKTSFIKTSDGKKYKFLKVTGIPASPDRIDAQPGKKYSFKVYFEKLSPGYELIDLIESNADKQEQMTYWNFHGITIKNPGEKKNKTIVPEKEIAKTDDEENQEDVVEENQDFRLYGKVLDANSGKPISAKIICLDPENNNKVDSLLTSKSGNYEFFVPNKELVYVVTSEGFEGQEDSFDPKVFFNKGSFQRDIYLEPLKKEELTETKTEIPVGEKLDSAATGFKLDKVYFNLGDATVLPESYDQLNQLADYLKNNPKLKIQIEGHTDNRGDADANKKLSLDRAYKVREYLVNKGIPGERIKFKGYGDTRPVVTNDKEENRRLNRRVEYKILED
ncbi:MAG: OmpA family protein [Cytophagaceae bacterium]|nr:OmpA family protein [Cytophagaceae bacterium]